MDLSGLGEQYLAIAAQRVNLQSLRLQLSRTAQVGIPNGRNSVFHLKGFEARQELDVVIPPLWLINTDSFMRGDSHLINRRHGVFKKLSTFRLFLSQFGKLLSNESHLPNSSGFYQRQLTSCSCSTAHSKTHPSVTSTRSQPFSLNTTGRVF